MGHQRLEVRQEQRLASAQGTMIVFVVMLVFVVAGKAPGTTSLRVSTEHGGAALTLEVVKAP